MSNHRAHDRPAKATALDGEVVLHGMGQLGVSMTPKAAKATGRRLTNAAVTAAKQAKGKAQL